MEHTSSPSIRCVQTVSAQRMAAAAAGAVEALLAQGEAPENVLVVTATQGHKEAFLAAAGAVGAKVRTFHELTQDVLRCNDAADKIGRAARVLLPSEEKVLLEDLKVSGLKINRLREMMKFFFRGITEGRDTEEGWLINNEELSLLAFAQDHLKEMGAILTYERSNLALKCLEVAGVRKAQSACHVVVCGHSSLDMCGQALVRELAVKSLTCIGHPYDDGCGIIAYPNPQGFADLAAGCPCEDADAAPSPLSELLGRIGSHIAAEKPLDPTRPGQVWTPGADDAVDVCASPAEDHANVAARVKAALEAGAEPADILVVTPNAGYTKSICEALGKEGVPAWAATAPAYVKGDPRKLDGGALKFICALNLVADPTDMVAWRTWLGMGDWLLRSDAWEVLRRIAGEQGVSMLEAIGLVRKCTDPSSGMQLGPQATGVLKLMGPIREADKLLAACEGLAGKALLAQVEAIAGWKLGHAERMLLQGCPGDARSILERLHGAVLDPASPRGAVCVGQPENLHGRLAKSVFLCGMVSGFFPCYQAVDEDETHDKRRARALMERRKLLMTLGQATEEVRFSCFAEADLEYADGSKVDIGRIFVRAGRRMATAKPSALLIECVGQA